MSNTPGIKWTFLPSIGCLSLLGCLVIAPFSGRTFGFQSSEHKALPQRPAITVQVKPSQIMPMQHTIVATGTVSAKDELSIGSEVNGLRVEQVLVEEGDKVSKGQVLARLNTSVLEAQLKENQALLAGAEASYLKSIQPNRAEDINSQKAAYTSTLASIYGNEYSVQKAKATYDNAAVVAQRYSFLLKEGGATPEEAQQKETDAKTALSAWKEATQNLEQAKQTSLQAHEKLLAYHRGGREEDIRVAKSTVDQYRSKIMALRANIQQAIICAPDDGYISERDVHIGNTCSANQTLFKMVRKGQLELQANLPQDDLFFVKIGQKVRIFDDHHSAEGRVWLISPSISSASRLAKVRIAIPDSSGFMTGMFATGQIATTTKNVLAIPEQALQSDSGTPYVYLCTNDICHKQVVESGQYSNGSVEILSGLKVGDPVVTEGAAFVNDNDVVRVAGDAQSPI